MKQASKLTSMFSSNKLQAKICHVSLNQSAMDFLGNRKRIMESIKFAKDKNCSYRTGAELEVTGYSCDDHFKEIDIFHHCWDTVAEIIKSGLTEGMVVDIGMPVLHKCVAYNCKVVIYNNKVVLVRPKMHLADEGNYREKRYFVAYTPAKNFTLERFYLPEYIQQLTGQDYCDFGYANLRFKDSLVGLEICEEFWRINSVSRASYISCDIILCGNASHFQKNKVLVRHQLIKELLQKSNGVYIYCNTLGFDGGSMYFDGGNLVVSKSGIIQYTDSCAMKDVCCHTVVIDLMQTREDRVGDINFMDEASKDVKIPEVFIDMRLADCQEPYTPLLKNFEFEHPSKQLMLAASSYLWDYIRKSGASGIFLPLSGGADSGITALIVYFMCVRLMVYVNEGDQEVLTALRKVVGIKDYIPKSPKEICHHIFSTSYMASANSGQVTRKRAKDLAEFIGADHSEVEIENIVKEFHNLMKTAFNITMKFQHLGGSWREDIALQNIYARVRMVLSYLLAQMAPIRKNKEGFYLVLSAGNLDETLTGYYTKYDASSGDLNLIGSLTKVDINECLQYLYDTFKSEVIREIYQAKPTAELKPAEAEQNDEDEIGLTFKQIDIFADARMNKNCSVVYFFKAVEGLFPDIPKEKLIEKISTFFVKYARNRHKVETLPNTVHLTSKNCSSKRFDLRPIIYQDQYRYELDMLRSLMLEEKPDKGK